MSPYRLHYARHFPRKQGEADMPPILKYSPFDGEGGPHKRWKGHKEGALYEVLASCNSPF